MQKAGVSAPLAPMLALLQAQPLSGWQHQIRRHFLQLAHPLIGEANHGKWPLNRAIAEHIGLAWPWLHARQLTMPHPAGGLPITQRAEPGPEWRRWLPPGGAGAIDP